MFPLCVKSSEDSGSAENHWQFTIPNFVVLQDKLLLDGSKRPVVTHQDKHGEKGGHQLDQGYQCSGDSSATTTEQHPTPLTSEGQPKATSLTSEGQPRATPLTSEGQPRATSLTSEGQLRATPLTSERQPSTVSQGQGHRRSATPSQVSSAVVGAGRRARAKPTTKPIPMSGEGDGLECD